MAEATNKSSGSSNGQPSETDRLEAEIEAARQQLGETVAALGYKLDVKTRARRSVAEGTERVKGSLTGPDGRLRPEVPAAGAAAVVLVVGLIVWRRRRKG